MANFEKDNEMVFNKLDPKNWKLSQNNGKVFQCPECKEPFNTKIELKQHWQEVHGIKCPYCKNYILKSKLEDHINKKHPPVACNICYQIFYGKKELSKHMREEHGFECNIPKRKFLTEGALLDHTNKKHNSLNKIQRKATPKSTKPKKQKKVKKVYTCPYCKAGFSRKKYLEHDKKKCQQKYIDAFVYKKNREKLIDEEPLRTIKNGEKKMVCCDLHELFIDESITEVINAIELCLQNSIEFLEIIHGHKHGNTLQTYFRSEEFLNHITHQNHKVEITDIFNPGSTIINIKR